MTAQVGGLDISLTKIGWARTRGDVTPWAATIRPRGRGSRRLEDGFRQTVAAMYGCGLVVIEGYSYNSDFGGERLAEMGGVVRLGLWQMEPRPAVVEIPPSILKKFATGNGNAKKEMMVTAARELLGYGRTSDDEADALWLVEAARQYYGLPGAADIPDNQVAVIRDIDWPASWSGYDLDF